MLGPQDGAVLLHLAGAQPSKTYQHLAWERGMSASEVPRALRRAGESGLYDLPGRRVRAEALLEFLQYGLRYVCPARRLPRGQGVVRGCSAEPLRCPLRADGRRGPGLAGCGRRRCWGNFVTRQISTGGLGYEPAQAVDNGVAHPIRIFAPPLYAAAKADAWRGRAADASDVQP